MSSILKALKKVEDDKAVRRPDELKIDAEILRADNPARFNSVGAAVIAMLLLAGGSGATYMYMKRGGTSSVDLKPAAAVSGQRQPPVASSAPDIKTEQLPPAATVVPAQQQNNAKAEIPAKSQKKTQKPAPTGATAAATKPASPAVTPKPAAQLKSAAGTTAPQSSAPVKAAVPALRVNGIAFQDGSTDSVAMVNGVPLSNGSMIDGVKIEEIHRNKVRFSYNGEKFEIPLGQSNR